MSAPELSVETAELGRAAAAAGSALTIVPEVPRELAVKRSDPVYLAHSYLTKVPVEAIAAMIGLFSRPGDLVLDPFAGSGMTGVAAAITGRRAELRDISVLGRHIGSNYLNLIEPSGLTAAATAAIERAKERLGDVYAVRCQECGERAELSRTTWSKLYACSGCDASVNYYRALETADGQKDKIACPECGQGLALRAAGQVGEEPVLDTVTCACSSRLREQEPSEPLQPLKLDGLVWPDVQIGEERQMFRASALAKHGLVSTARFFSTRNLAVLAALHAEILAVQDEAVRSKLLFAFTAILARASKRYQWSRKRPLNATNQHYYIAPVFYEWNVIDLFRRKLAAVIRSDNYIRERIEQTAAPAPAVNYQLGSAEALDLPDGSVDYIFTDPPFGSHLFYSDMNLFQEAWLGDLTDPEREAVIDRPGSDGRRDVGRYERLISEALRECHRVLKPGRWLSLVFSNADGAIWALLQRALTSAGFQLEAITTLDKGQRSIKGMTSGSENVVTADLILSLRKVEATRTPISPLTVTALTRTLAQLLNNGAETVTAVYLGLVRTCLRDRLDLSEISIANVKTTLELLGCASDPSTGRLRQTGLR